MATRSRCRGVFPSLAAWVLFAALAGCATSPGYKGRDGGSGGVSGSGGAAGRGDYGAPACDPAASILGQVMAPAPLISLGKRVVAGPGVVANVDRLVDGLYPHTGVFIPATRFPGWLAIELGAGATRVMLSWADIGWGDYNQPEIGGSPADYTIETSADSTDGQDGTWTQVVAVTANPVRERAHTFDFTGKSWVRLTVTAHTNIGAGTPGLTLDELEIHDVSATAAGARPDDTWLFMGDSITVNAFRRQFGAANTFEGRIRAARPGFSPIVINGGIGGDLSGMGLAHLPDWLALNPDVRHVALLYGTNDSWGDKAPEATPFEANMRALVQMILEAGRVPILARIPYSKQAVTTLPAFNAIIDAIATAKGLPCGPDLYGWFRDHPEEVTADGVHPTEAGYRSINKLWADAMLGLYPPPATAASGAN